MKNTLQDIKHDLPASIVVFFVAVPLCLGIALASGAPLFAGIISGIVGGIVVGSISGSALGVSGPAAGLAVIVATSIASLGGSWEAFLTAVKVIIDCSKSKSIAYDVVELIKDYESNAKIKNVVVEKINFIELPTV